MPVHSPGELRILHVFRSAALQVRNASVIARGETIRMQFHFAEDQPQTQFTTLAEEPFRSLAISIRLVYLQREEANYRRVCNLLHRSGSPDVQARTAACRSRYEETLDSGYVRFNLHGEFEGQTAGPRRILEAWLHGVAFHQDPEKRAVVEELAKYQNGRAFPFAVNMIVLRLAGVIIDLDDVIADHLGEERMPRIRYSSDAASGSETEVGGG